MATAAQEMAELSRPLVWFWEFVKNELTPYPGRAELVARIVVAATIVMILTMTFRIPFGAVGAVFTFLISRESQRATVNSATATVIAFGLATVYVLVGGTFALGYPPLRVLWIMGTFFIMFYGISVIANYAAAIAFGLLIVFTIPLWDMHIPVELKVEGTLWALLQMAIGCAVTLFVEAVFAAFRGGNELLRAIGERLSTVEALLKSYSAGEPVDERTEKTLTRHATVGTSRLRRIVRTSDRSLYYAEQMSTIVVLVGRLVDIASNLTYLTIQLDDLERKRIRNLAESIAGIRSDFLNGRQRTPIEFSSESDASHVVPLLSEMETTVSLMSQVFSGSEGSAARLPLPPREPPSRLFVADALSNTEHLKFGLRGALAASLCYIIYTAVAWPGISVSLLICMVTALGTIGASRQKQLLSITGAIAGGVVLGIGAQIFILPYLDSITGFTLLFIGATSIGAWLYTSSSRFSNFGYQLMLAFFFINLGDFKVQTSLTLARDRVIGILLGLFMMWLIFDQLWGAPAVVAMQNAFTSSLRQLAQLAGGSLSKDLTARIERTYSLRETINANLDKVRALADAVLFEFGPRRQENLLLRERILAWQTKLRAIFVMETTWLKYRVQLPGFELPDSLREAQLEFDYSLAKTLDSMANRIESGPSGEKQNFENALERLELKLRDCCSNETSATRLAQLQTFQSLSRRLGSLTAALDNEI